MQYDDDDSAADFDPKVLREHSIAQQFQQDAQVWQAYLKDETVNAAPVSSAKKDIVKRIFTLLQHGELKHKTHEGYKSVAEVNKELASDENLQIEEQPPFTLAAALSHGGRVLVKIPPLQNPNQDPNQFLKWVIGEENKLAPNAKKSKEAPVFIRAAATHTINVSKIANPRDVSERKISPLNPRHLVRFITDYLNKRHLGMNVGLGSKDKAAPDNGSNGHVYMYWKPPTLTEKGALMLGCENSAPGKVNRYGKVHGMRGKSDEFSPTGGEKFSNKKFTHYRVQAPKVGGLQIELNEKELQAMLQRKAGDFDPSLLNKPIGQQPFSEPKQKKWVRGSFWAKGNIPTSTSQPVAEKPDTNKLKR